MVGEKGSFGKVGMRQEMKGFADGQLGGAPARRRSRRLSQLFARLADQASGPVSLATIRDALGDRSFAPLLAMFCNSDSVDRPCFSQQLSFEMFHVRLA